MSPCEICEVKKPEESFDEEADDRIFNDCRRNGPHTASILLKLADMLTADPSLRSAVARHALDLDDPIDFLKHLDRPRTGEAFFETFGAEEEPGKAFFDGHYPDIQSTLALMHSA